ncbi:glycosyltransferase family protein [Tautonia sociabilis]|uniref:YfhO family protein n=1 Tax=Tautonia sociabilis TaxID=2080755 RepID=A0A432MCT1_9BACT|nr:hypothetical protein [Tautonia sociabilis]RUL82211.1 hypothetical protein TsocGM_23790 [Tautonia sociabilis]
MGRIVGGAGVAAILAAALLLGFSGLVAAPGSLIVDGERPWVDEGHPPGSRPIGNDLTALFLPRHLWQSWWWHQGARIPRWDPRGFAGRPNAGNPQAGIWYPPTWLSWTSGSPAAPGWLTVAHLFWAGLGAAALGRAVGLGGAGATAAGAVFMVNPYVIAQVCEGHLPHVWAASWMPWAFLGAVRMRRGERIGRVLLPTSLAMALLAGHPQEGLYLALALGAWAAADGLAALRGRPGPMRSGQVVARWGIALGLGVGLAAVDWVPALAARPWVAGPLGGEGGGGSGPYHLHGSNAWQLLSPRALGGPSDYLGRGNWWESLCSIGWAPLVLLAVGVAGFPERRAVLGWCALLGGSLVHAAGEGLGLAAIVGGLPGFEGVRVPARSLFLAATAAAVLAGMGVEVVSRTIDRPRAVRRARRYGATVALIALAVALAAALPIERGSHDDSIRSLAIRSAMACRRIAGDGLTVSSALATGIALVWAAIRPAEGREAAWFLVGVAIVELAATAAMAVPLCPPERFLSPDAVSRAIARVRPPGAFRVRALDRIYSDLDAWRDGVEKTNLNDLFQLRRPAELYRALYPIFDEPGPRSGTPRTLDPRLAREALDRLGVGLVVTDRPVRLPVGPVVASASRGGEPISIRAHPGALPRAYVVPDAEVVPGEEEGAALDRLADVDPIAVVLMGLDPLAGLEGPRQPFTPARFEAVDPDLVVVRVATEAPGLLVVLDAWMPGWSASVDGEPAPVCRGDHAFRVVPITRGGSHEVVLTYRAPGLGIGSAITAASLAVMLAGAARRGTRKSRGDDPLGLPLSGGGRPPPGEEAG